MMAEKRKHKPTLNKDIFDKLNTDFKKEDLELKLDDLEISEQQILSDINLNIIAESYHKNFNNQKLFDWFNNHAIKKLNRLIELKINLGFSDGSLINMLSENQADELLKLNVLNDKHERFLNCITIPVVDEFDQVINIYGININDDTVKSLNDNYLFNQKACKIYDEIILTESIIDALSLIELDFNNVISIENADNLKPEYIKILKDNRVKTVIIAFKKEVSSVFNADKIKSLLIQENIAVKEITQITADDWNKELLEGITREDVLNIINVAQVFNSQKTGNLPDAKKDITGYIFTINEITYKVSGVKENFGVNVKVNIRVEFNNDWFPDVVDLNSSRSREGFSLKISQKFNVESKRIEKDLLSIFDYLDNERIKRLKGDKEEKQELTEDERKLGFEFLKSANLFEQIVSDMDMMLCVGERLNKQLLYLCATSRLMDNQISMLLLSQSASGKTYLVETMQKLIPEDEVIDFDTLSKQALQYIGVKLMNKFLIMGEAVHDPEIEHQIRTILSSQKLSRYVVVKNEKTGEMTTEQVLVKTAASSVLTSTNTRMNLENLTRYFITNTDESPEQTRRIYEAQRKKYSVEMQHVRKVVIPQIIKKHHAAQRLLKKITIVIPSRMREKLRFPDRIMRLRRDHLRFIDLIACVCFLRQYQKETKSNGEFEYIECDYKDYEIAYDILMNGILPSTVSEIGKSAIEVHGELKKMTKKLGEERGVRPEEVTLTQKEIREHTGFANTWIKTNVKLLVDFEYVEVVKGGKVRSKGYYRVKNDEEIKQVDLKMIPTPEEMKRILEGKEIN